MIKRADSSWGVWWKVVRNHIVQALPTKSVYAVTVLY